jgi:hypothetical protein
VDRDQTITSVETMSAIVGRDRGAPAAARLAPLPLRRDGAAARRARHLRVLAFAVTQRRQEIGLRVALGASPRSVLGLVVSRG